ncbi:leucine-rich repeat-containing protein 69 isoform X1 [Octopus bimaculoides]|uniref:Leucine-rich repeat-containing protein 69 n=1 Tax=Octopus bimaculoides TaxID=37653 RepID=A0A0L8G8S1_OCTBM|nr:leucine-rich repeat-containing protein 69 isoform X1 [Octopus bimaculoides]|eukprot:XP_014783183.1 PREDICTED: leucine-rich repeat-containing protein 69-like isoform X1 [Octopus bimaculoides]
MVTPIIGRILNSRSKTLDLSQKHLRKCPDMICQLPKLEKVILTNNELNELPDDFGNIKQLQLLDIAGNEFQILPVQIQHLLNLKKLLAYRNKIKSLPPGIFGGLKSLTVLNLNKNELHKIPAEIGGLINLKYFSAEHNHLTELPEELCQLQQLEELHIGYNRLVTLPVNLGSLQNLKELHAHRNHLQELPGSISKCIHLTVLDVASNNLNIFPVEFDKLHLKRFHYECNPLLQSDLNPSYRDADIFPLKELVVRFVMNEMKRHYPMLWNSMIERKEIQQIVEKGNHCVICNGFHLHIHFSCVTFFNAKKRLKTQTPKGPIPMQILLCSSQCFKSKESFSIPPDVHISLVSGITTKTS